jgi:serpin B
VEDVARANNQFAFDLYGRIGRDHPGNFSFSPAGLSSALALVAAGARGETQDEMWRVLRGPDGEARTRPAYRDLLRGLTGPGAKDGGHRFQLVNRLWGQAGCAFTPEFLDTADDVYRAGAQHVGFRDDPAAARRQINGWVREQTAGKVRDFLPDGAVGPDTRLVLTNVVSFQAAWESPFDRAYTRPASFRVTPKVEVKVPTMSQELTVAHADVGEATLVEVPYAGGETAMLIVRPNGPGGLDGLEGSFSADKLAGWRKALKEREVILALPRFSTGTTVELTAALGALGMKLPFGAGADFTGMCGRGMALQLSEVIHQAAVTVDEEGTEATAASAITAGGLSMPAVVRVDQPFAFLIVHKPTGEILFLGRVVNPAD